MFAFQFVNSYCALLYVGFWLRDINRLRQLVMMMMMVKQFVAQIVEMYQPVLMRWLKDRNDKKNVRDQRICVTAGRCASTSLLFRLSEKNNLVIDALFVLVRTFRLPETNNYFP